MSSRTVVAVHWGGLKFIGSTGISVRQGLRAPIKKAAKTDEVIHLIYVIKAKLICLGNNGAMRVQHCSAWLTPPHFRNEWDVGAPQRVC